MAGLSSVLYQYLSVMTVEASDQRMPPTRNSDRLTHGDERCPAREGMTSAAFTCFGVVLLPDVSCPFEFLQCNVVSLSAHANHSYDQHTL